MKIEQPPLGGAGRPEPIGARRLAPDARPDPATDASAAATVHLSSRSRELHAAVRAADQAPDVRAELVREVRARIDSGTYRIEPEVIARRLLDRRA